MAVSGVIKPPLWGPVGPGLVAPEWRWAWNGLTFAAPLWEGGGDGRDIIQRQFSSAKVGSWGASQKGIAWITDASGEYMRWPDKVGYHLDGDIDFSVFVSVEVTGFNGTLAGLIMHRTSGADDGYWMILYTVASGDITFQWRASGTTRTVVWSSAWPGNGEHSFMLTRKIGGTHELFINGDSQGTKSSANAPMSAGTHDVFIGRVENAARNVFGKWHSAYIWKNVALAKVHAELLHRDPFGPFRMEDIAPWATVAPPAAAIMAQMQFSNLGADLHDGALIQ